MCLSHPPVSHPSVFHALCTLHACWDAPTWDVGGVTLSQVLLRAPVTCLALLPHRLLSACVLRHVWPLQRHVHGKLGPMLQYCNVWFEKCGVFGSQPASNDQLACAGRH